MVHAVAGRRHRAAVASLVKVVLAGCAVPLCPLRQAVLHRRNLIEHPMDPGRGRRRIGIVAPSGTPLHDSGGETSSPSPVYCFGIGPFAANTGLVSVRVIACTSQVPLLPRGPRAEVAL